MKKINLIKRLWKTDSHEKQTPQRFARYAGMLLMLLTLGVGQMWAETLHVRGYNNNWSDQAFNLMTGSSSPWTFTADWTTNWEFKISSDATGKQWLGKDGDFSLGDKVEISNGGNMRIPGWSSGTYTITVTYENSKYYMTVTAGSGGGGGGGSSSYPDKYIAGGNASWLSADWNTTSDKMTNNGDGTYSITVLNVSKAQHKFKLCNGSWGSGEVGWGSSRVSCVNGICSGESGDGSNIQFTPYIAGTVTVTYNSNTDRIVISCAKIPITLSRNGGSSDGSATVDVGASSLSSITHVSRTGYNLTGYWTTTSGGYKVINNDGTFVTYSSNVSTYLNNATPATWKKTSATTLNAQWTAKNYTVTLDKNGGDSDGSITTTYNSSSGSSFSAASRPGYSCDGYFTANEGGTEIIDKDGNLKTGTVSGWLSSGKWVKDAANIKLYAHWTVDITNYNVNFGVDASGHGSITAANSSTSAAISNGASVANGTGVTFTASPNSYYEVEGWYTDDDCTAGKHDAGETSYTTSVSGADLNAYVKFQPITYTITYNLNSGTNNPSNPANYTYESSAITLQDPTRTGYTFGGWYTEVGLTNRVYSIAAGSNGNKAFWAKWTENKSTVTVNANQTSMGTLKFGSTDKSWGTTASVGVTTSQSIKATANSGYVFDRWVLSGGAASPTTLTNATITLKANGSGSAGTAKAVFGIEYYYRGDKNDWANQSSDKLVPHESGLYAYYTATTGAHTFQITPNSGNYDGECHTVDNSLGTITLTEVDNGFGGTKVSCPAVGSTHYILICYPNTDINESSDPVICASTTLPTFVETTYAVTFAAGANGSVSVRGNDISAGSSQSVQIGTIGRTLTATPASGYHFVRWNTTGGASVASATSATTTVTATGTGTVTATWIAASNWYLHGQIDGEEHWHAGDSWPHNWPVDNPYRGVSGVYYRPISTINKDAYFGVFYNDTQKYSGNDSGSDYTWDGSFHDLVANNNSKCFYTSAAFSDKWVVINTNDTKKIWIQSPTTYYTVTVSNEGLGARGTVVLKEKSYGNLTTNQFASGETIRVEIDTVAHYRIKSVKLGETSVTMTHSSGTKFTGDVVMPASNKTLTVTYTPKYQVNFSRTPTAAANAPTNNKSLSNGDYIESGTSVTFTHAAANTGYSWYRWENGSGSSLGTGDTYTATISGTTTVVAKYTEDMHTVTVTTDGHGTITTPASGSPRTVSAGIATGASIAASANTGYTFYNWTKTSGSGDVTFTNANANSTTVKATSDATVRANFVDQWNLKGDQWGSDWSEYKPLTATANANEYSVSLSLTKGTKYQFKVVKRTYNGSGEGTTDVWYGTTDGAGNKVFERGESAFTTVANGMDNNLEVTADVTGTYTFTISTSGSTPVITVTYPTAYTITYGAGTINGSSTAISVSPSFTSGDYVLPETDVTFSKGSTKTGYIWKGWYSNVGGTGDAWSTTDASLSLTATRSANISVYACYNYATYTATLSTTGCTGYGSGAPADQTVTYTQAMPTITPPTAANGYCFMGYWDDEEGEGTQYYNANGTSAHIWDKTSGATLYAYFKKAEITAITFDEETVEAGRTVSFAVTISPTPDGTTKTCFTVLHSNDNPLAEQPTITYSAGKYSFTAPATSGTYKIYAVLRTGSSCDGGTELDTEEASFQVAGLHDVTVRYKCGDDVIKAATTLEGIRPLVWSDAITAPDIVGYSFTGWEAGDGVTLTDDDGSSTKTSTATATIKIKAIYDGYLTANYSKKRIIYFNNTLNWDTVVVYFYKNSSYWGNTQGSGANTTYTFTNTPYSEGKHGGMKRVAPGSNIWYFDAEAAGVNASYQTVVFTDKDQHGCNYFYNNVKVIKRDDYYSTKLPMFVPVASQTPDAMNSNAANYYNKGYWMNYPENTGYTLKIYNKKETDGATELKSIPFNFTENKTMPMELDVDLEAGLTYGFKIYRNDGQNDGAGSFFGNTGTMTANTEGWDMTTEASSNTGLQTTAAGSYKFILNYYAVSSTYHYRVSVTYPVTTGDYRLIYKDNVHSAWHPSAVIPKANAKDTVSFFVRKGQAAILKLQKCTGLGAGTVTWTDTVTWWDGSSLPSAITQDSVYNLCLMHNASTGKLEIEKIEAYTGNYYIRVDAANSKWDNYRTDPDHLMTYSEYSITHGGYSHYYTHWVQTDDRKNIKFTIANDYSPCISDTLARETASGDWANITYYVESNGDLKRNANVRFMWNQSTNVISRAYVDGAQEDGSRFLVISSADGKIKKADGTALSNNEVTFSDNGNWIYEANIKAQPKAQIKLVSTWGTGTVITQYFKGSATETEDLVGGSGDSWYDIRVIYDFKTNRLISSYIPSGEIDGDLQINADVMFIREHQGDIAQLTFTKDSKISKIETAYGVLRLNKWTINNKSKADGHAPLSPLLSRYERDLFYVSFPFRVSMEEVFGFGTYGTHWIIEYYDGASRAANGYWQESGPNWKFVTNRKGKFFEPNQGYIIALELDLLNESSDIWANTDVVELYFPSYGTMPDITKDDITLTLPSHQCTIDRSGESNGHGGTLGSDYDRRVKDSHWNVMSVPTYVNPDAPTFANTKWTTAGDTTLGPNFLYEWNMDDNSVTAVSGATYTYHAMHAYLVQYWGNVKWSSSVSPAAAPRMNPGYRGEYEFRLELKNNDATEDQTFVKLSDNEAVTTEFEFNYDMSKEFNKKKANIYTMTSNNETVAGNCLPLTYQTTIVPVGVQIKTDGEYTFSMPDGTDGIGVTLIDNETGEHTNLGLTDYTVNLNAGSINDRFVLEISAIQGSTTDIEEITGNGVQGTGVRKVMIDGILYIVRDGQVFDARGARVQ